MLKIGNKDNKTIIITIGHVQNSWNVKDIFKRSNQASSDENYNAWVETWVESYIGWEYSRFGITEENNSELEDIAIEIIKNKIKLKKKTGKRIKNIKKNSTSGNME